jgi:hypothetical protein
LKVPAKSSVASPRGKFSLFLRKAAWHPPARKERTCQVHLGRHHDTTTSSLYKMGLKLQAKQSKAKPTTTTKTRAQTFNYWSRGWASLPSTPNKNTNFLYCQESQSQPHHYYKLLPDSTKLFLNKSQQTPFAPSAHHPSAADSAEYRNSIAASLHHQPICSQVLGFRVKRIAIKYYSHVYNSIACFHIQPVHESSTWVFLIFVQGVTLKIIGTIDECSPSTWVGCFKMQFWSLWDRSSCFWLITLSLECPQKKHCKSKVD